MGGRLARVAAAIVSASFVSVSGAPRAVRERPASVEIMGRQVPDVISAADARAVAIVPDGYAFVVVSANSGERVTVHCPSPNFEADPPSLQALAQLMSHASPKPEGSVDPRLISLLREIAQASGGIIEVVSAYRPPTSRRDRNYHVRGLAADIRVPGLTTRKLRDLATDLGIKGIGYYPTSKMIHLDLREVPYTWTDWSAAVRSP